MWGHPIVRVYLVHISSTNVVTKGLQEETLNKL